jgi:serine phosphatase RsbU (regulator of sigma subunit)
MIETTIPESAVKEEFYRSTEKAHVIACWVGIILNLVWFISDYFVLPDHWIQFSVFRISVSGISFIALMLKKRLNIDIYTCLFLLVLGISVQNAYMWSVMDIPHLQQHAFAYIALFIGVGMMVLWEVKLSLVLMAVTVISNIVFFVLNSPLTVQEFLTHGAMLTLTVVVFCVFMIRTRYRLTYKEIKSRLELAYSKKIIEIEHATVTEQKKEILDSINYAKRIQSAMLTSENIFSKYLKNYFVLFKPKDIVSGDFYWATPISEHKFILITADSTGHGVPGAMMSMLNISCLNEAVNERKLLSPAAILNHARQRIISSLAEDGSAEGGKDGMDCSVVVFDFEHKQITYAAANNPIWIVRFSNNNTEAELIDLKPDRMPVGKHDKDKEPFSEHTFELQDGDVVYTLTDGFADQFGGVKQKKFTYKKLKEMLLKINTNGCNDQKAYLTNVFTEWKGKLDQVDDVLIIGVKVKC